MWIDRQLPVASAKHISSGTSPIAAFLTYGTYIGSAITGPVPQGYLIGVLGGHAAGRWKSRELGMNPLSGNHGYQYERQLEGISTSPSQPPAEPENAEPDSTEVKAPTAQP